MQTHKFTINIIKNESLVMIQISVNLVGISTVTEFELEKQEESCFEIKNKLVHKINDLITPTSHIIYVRLIYGHRLFQSHVWSF